MFDQAIRSLRAGGVVAYPTESCFGLGCDPAGPPAIRRILKLKQRKHEKGLILIAADVRQLEPWVDFSASPLLQDILASWPGPYTWILPAKPCANRLLTGIHETLAVRVTAHPVAAGLCRTFGVPLVSTSANLHGKPALKSAWQVQKVFGNRLESIIYERIGGMVAPSEIKHGITGQTIRAGAS